MSKQSEESGNKQVGSIAEVGLMADFRARKSALNPKLLVEIRQREAERWLDDQYEKLLKTFKSRFEENPQIFDGIDDADVFTVFEPVSQIMLLFFPSRISADVTFDTSLILQGHYGAFRVYLEIFFPIDTDEPLHSTLNIYADQSLVFTGGGKAEEMIAEFIRILPALIEKKPRVQIA